jgi:hypothetical protein
MNSPSEKIITLMAVGGREEESLSDFHLVLESLINQHGRVIGKLLWYGEIAHALYDFLPTLLLRTIRTSLFISRQTKLYPPNIYSCVVCPGLNLTFCLTNITVVPLALFVNCDSMPAYLSIFCFLLVIFRVFSDIVYRIKYEGQNYLFIQSDFPVELRIRWFLDVTWVHLKCALAVPAITVVLLVLDILFCRLTSPFIN